ncbi:putative conjugative transfer protein TraD [Orientia tsutsugamushi str. TA716]|uniref:Putative conjugative transfer protein TraD n=1 Tax=Orientia tsutsugamushi str. TA716 TaxID=1359175 RepID=A0A0F3NSL3_ORITS|nr:putative conjugative transfer protein TraD [Orientia tsutsugamushi str. TA716]
MTIHQNVQNHWTTIGKDIFDKEQQNKAAVILKFASEPDENTKRHIRLHGLKWIAFVKNGAAMLRTLRPKNRLSMFSIV